MYSHRTDETRCWQLFGYRNSSTTNRRCLCSFGSV